MKEILGHYITKIEGHGKLKVDFSKERAELHVDEGERLFEGLVLGRIYEDAPLISARICGVCPTAHTFAAIDALENALDIKVPEYIADYRRIMLSLQIFQSHVLHLFFLAAPDYLNIDSALDLAEKNPEVFQIVLDLKRLADEGIELIGGRSIHPVTPVVGGFTKLPDYRKLLLYRNRLEKNLVHAVEAAKLFAKFHYPHMEREREYLSLQDSSYPLIGEEVVSSAGKNFKVTDYQKNISEKVNSYSTAKFSTKDGKGFMVGSIARVNLKFQLLNKMALEIAKGQFPSNNPFKNNLAQAVEMVHFMEEIILLIDKVKGADVSASRINYEVKSGKGAGCIEAPRGLLFHYYELNSKGIIVNCDIITPTAQNLTSIEDDADELLKISHHLSRKEQERQIEMLIRAYDPCITCSVH